MAMNVGLYLGYDFMPSRKADYHGYDPATGEGTDKYKEQEGTFDIGLQLGFKFGPKA